MLLSPGVAWREQDYSTYVNTFLGTSVAILGGATKGPVNKPTRISNVGELTRTFGPAVSSNYGLIAAQSFLNFGSQLWYVRVTDNTDVEAGATFSIGGDDVFDVQALTTGSWFNDQIRTRLLPGRVTGTYDYRVEFITGTGDNDYVVLETFRGINFDAEDTVNFIENAVNVGRPSERESQYISVTVVWDYIGMGADPVFTLPTTGETELLAAGADGITGLVAAHYIGTDNGFTKTGLQTIASIGEIDISLLAVPGITYDAVQAEMIRICAVQRKDCVAILDSPFGLSADEFADFTNGEGIYAGRAILNSSYAAIYWPWAKTFVNDLGTSIFVPPSAVVLRKYAETDTASAVWYPPAGMRRGLLNDVLELEQNPSLGSQDFLYSGGNVGNCLTRVDGVGYVINGQRTTLRQPSALDRIAVRRMVNYLQKIITAATRYLVFEPNDRTTWEAFKALVSPVLQRVKDQRGITEYAVIADETTTNAVARDRKEMYGIIKVKPMSYAEFIYIDFALVAQGAKV